jgi:Peptidase family M1 domain
MRLRSALAAFLTLLTAAAARADADPTYTALRAARPSGTAVAVRNLKLERDVFRFEFVGGSFQFLEPVSGRVTGAVFVGEGTWQLTPAGEGARRHLALLQNDSKLEILTDRFESLVLLFTDGTEAEIRTPGADASADGRAASVWDSFRKRQRKDLKSNLQLRLLADVLGGTEPSSGVFIALVDGKKLPPAAVVVDPSGLRWISDMSMAGDAGSLLYVVHEREGGSWYLEKRRNAAAPPATPPARATHYAIETTIRKNERLQGDTTISVEALQDGVRVLPLGLLGQLRIRDAELSAGATDSAPWKAVAFIQEDHDEDADAAVVLPAAFARGEQIRLRLVYEGGEVLYDAGDGNFAVGARTSWYPNLGVFEDSATYDLTYRIPKSYEIVSVGDLVDSRVENDARISVWKADQPIRVAGFNYGKFKRLEQKDPDSGLHIQVFTNPGVPDALRGLSGVRPEKLADSAMADGINTARVGSVYFGSLPFGHVAITQQSQFFFGQSWPSLIFLPYISFLDSYNRFRIGLQSTQGFVDIVGPHEFAHQWWGHLVGWNSYRDQWLSEGFAEFTAGLVLEYTSPRSRVDEFWDKAARNIVDKPAHAYVSNDRAGPISDGWRLSTWRNPAAGQAMIYDKGAWVVQMLRTLMRDPKTKPPDERFIATMKDFVSTYAGKNPSTRDFQTVVERHMSPAMDLEKNGKMDWFFRQWIDGIEIPRYSAEVAVQDLGGGRYKLVGTARQEAVSDGFVGFLPLYLEFEKGTFSRLGLVSFRGTANVAIDTAISLPKKPRRVVANAMNDVLSRD